MIKTLRLPHTQRREKVASRLVSTLRLDASGPQADPVNFHALSRIGFEIAFGASQIFGGEAVVPITRNIFWTAHLVSSFP
jgi:hypothetical protein